MYRIQLCDDDYVKRAAFYAVSHQSMFNNNTLRWHCQENTKKICTIHRTEIQFVNVHQAVTKLKVFSISNSFNKIQFVLFICLFALHYWFECYSFKIKSLLLRRLHLSDSQTSSVSVGAWIFRHCVFHWTFTLPQLCRVFWQQITFIPLFARKLNSTLYLLNAHCWRLIEIHNNTKACGTYSADNVANI